jgi:hypothetical protein
MSHKDYTKQPEEFLGQLPSAYAMEIADLFANGKSNSDIQGIVRINGQKLSRGLTDTVVSHIKKIESTVVNILKGTSIIYTPPEIEDEDGNGTGTYAWASPEVPTTYAELITVLMQVIALDGDNFSNVYDVADFIELQTQIEHVVNNIIKYSNGTGSADWAFFKTCFND